MASALKVFPVPTRDALTISQTTGAKIASVRVMNLNGQLLAEIAGNSRTEVQVSLSGFAAGMYQVVVNFEGGETVTRRVEKL